MKPALVVALALCTACSQSSPTDSSVDAGTGDRVDPQDVNAGPPISVVLTFDDGPVDAHVPRSEAVARSESDLLRPLDDILATLGSHEIRAVFYIEGPWTEQAATDLLSVHRAGVERVLGAGHIVGYHAFNHDPDLWLTNVQAPALIADMDRISDFFEQLGIADRATPIFRPPFGGVGAARWRHRLPRRDRARLDCPRLRDRSVDWTQNATADPDLVARLPVSCETDRRDYSLSKIDAAVARTADRALVDVLFHVNPFTAEYLGELISAIATAFAERGRTARFEVPDAYLKESDREADTSFLNDLSERDCGP